MILVDETRLSLEGRTQPMAVVLDPEGWPCDLRRTGPEFDWTVYFRDLEAIGLKAPYGASRLQLAWVRSRASDWGIFDRIMCKGSQLHSPPDPRMATIIQLRDQPFREDCPAPDRLRVLRRRRLSCGTAGFSAR